MGYCVLYMYWLALSFSLSLYLFASWIIENFAMLLLSWWTFNLWITMDKLPFVILGQLGSQITWFFFIWILCIFYSYLIGTLRQLTFISSLSGFEPTTSRPQTERFMTLRHSSLFSLYMKPFPYGQSFCWLGLFMVIQRNRLINMLASYCIQERHITSGSIFKELKSENSLEISWIIRRITMFYILSFYLGIQVQSDPENIACF